ncbi:iron reductase domain protein [Apiospora sp. TS-2023a]
MFSLRRSAVLSALASYAALTHAAPQQTCPTTDVCFAVGVPQKSASSDSGNIYFQISAPTTYSWIGLGTGSRMSGSNMFIMYQDGNGNVTISPRQGTNHQMPVLDTSSTAAKLTLLAGSGVVDGGKTMRANVACANCESWANGGSMQLTSTSSPWIAGWKSGDSLATTDKNAAISQHDDVSSWSYDLTQATISSDANPFINAQQGGGSSGGGGSGFGSGGSSGAPGSSGPGVIPSGGGFQSARQEITRLQRAHGIIMALVFVILYPVGSILMPLLGKWMFHAAFQFFNFVLMWVGFGLGYVLSQKTFMGFSETHTVFGTVIVCLMVLQPIGGSLHHMYYVKHQSRGIVSHVHIWYGRALMILGVINGGLGIELVRNSGGGGTGLIVAYSVVAGVIALLYIAVKGFTSFRKRRGGGSGGSSMEGRKKMSNAS